MSKIILQTVLMLCLLAFGTFLLNLSVNYHLKRLNVNLTTEQLKEVKWLVSSVVTILTAFSYLLYLVLHTDIYFSDRYIVVWTHVSFPAASLGKNVSFHPIDLISNDCMGHSWINFQSDLRTQTFHHLFRLFRTF